MSDANKQTDIYADAVAHQCNNIASDMAGLGKPSEATWMRIGGGGPRVILSDGGVPNPTPQLLASARYLSAYP